MTTKITDEHNNLNLDRDYMDNCCTSVVAKPKGPFGRASAVAKTAAAVAVAK
jgi:hypothetical protein